MSIMRYLHQKGDTIVEVIIAMAVLGLVLGGAYASSRRSLNATIQAHEHSTALKLAEGQVENLKYLSEIISPSPAQNIYNTAYDGGLAFCINGSSQVVNAATTGYFAAATATTLTDYSANCNPNSAGYYIAVGRSSANIFTVYVRWDNIHGSGQDQVTLAYKLDR